ncbi:uncharacterized protein Dwil_GK26855 [Drosophila willistoni]|uniref:translation initiation factor IF-2 isoform X1 n=1 Tax=Drosophila willistoni TaxID=7260 RepID=UPI0007327034|nr:translation initiation factor IF-2 isoform X1 [Drosophila willistoni]KRF98038.1 uncharacterized protein Dwil_GK26855 [Drosophila willistoni]
MRLFVVVIIGVLCALQLSGLSEAKPWIKELLEFKKALLSKAIEYMPQSRAPTIRREIHQYKLSCIDEVNEFAKGNMPEMPQKAKDSSGTGKLQDPRITPENSQNISITNFNIILQSLRDVFRKEENLAQKKLIEQLMILVQNLINQKSERDSPSLPSNFVLVAIKNLLINTQNNHQSENSKKYVPNYAEILKILLGQTRITDSSQLDIIIQQETVVPERSNIEEALGIVVEKVLPPTQSGSFNFTIELEEPTVVIHEVKELSDRRTNDVGKQSSDQQVGDEEKQSTDLQDDDGEKESSEKQLDDVEKQTSDNQLDDVEKQSSDKQADEVKNESSDKQADEVKNESSDKQADEVKNQSSDKQADEVKNESSDKQADEVKNQSSDKQADEVKNQSSDKQADNAVKPRSPFFWGVGLGASASATVVAKAHWGSGSRKMRSPRVYRPWYYPVPVPVPVPVVPYPPYPYPYPYYPPWTYPHFRTERQKQIIRFELNRLIRLCVQRKVLQARATNRLLTLSTPETAKLI